jgi:UDP-2,3-diacylglucosamine pyrophosphatase LpxH
MQLEEVPAWFAKQGLPISWLIQKDGRKNYFQRLRPPTGTALDIAPLEIAIVIPDVHLGWGNDVFRFNDPTRERRLERFLDRVSDLKQHVNGNLEVFQVGDWYDFWRSPGVTHSQAKAIIESQYRGVVSRARNLGVKHCVGNHDAALAEADIRHGMDVEIVRSIGASKRVICLHGHDTASLASIAVQDTGRTIGLNIFNVFNSTAPLLGAIGAFVQRAIDGSSIDPWSSNPASIPWDKAAVPGPTGWGAPWVGRGSTIELGAALSGLELCIDRELQLAFVGHSHRPGVSWSPIAGRRVPVIDVGSWTYGRSEFAVVCPDGAGVAQLV